MLGETQELLEQISMHLALAVEGMDRFIDEYPEVTTLLGLANCARHMRQYYEENVGMRITGFNRAYDEVHNA